MGKKSTRKNRFAGALNPQAACERERGTVLALGLAIQNSPPCPQKQSHATITQANLVQIICDGYANGPLHRCGYAANRKCVKLHNATEMVGAKSCTSLFLWYKVFFVRDYADLIEAGIAKRSLLSLPSSNPSTSRPKNQCRDHGIDPMEGGRSPHRHEASARV
jgi:hypothetical protein